MLTASKSDKELHHIKMSQPEQVVESFKKLYQTLDATNCQSEIVDKVYRDDVLFQDSFHQIEGLVAMKEYFNALYLNLISCDFDFHGQWVTESSAMLTWTMTYSHQRLNRGRKIFVKGATEIRFDDKVFFHRDYFDGGDLLYEHVPGLGMVIKKLKKYMAK